MQSWKKDGRFSLVAARTFHLSSSTAPQKLVAAALVKFIAQSDEIKQ